MSAQLIRLPDGAWVQPDAVIAVVPHDAHSGKCGEFQSHAPALPRVFVHLRGERSNVQCLYCNTFDEAKALADELATRFNLSNAQPKEKACTPQP